MTPGGLPALAVDAGRAGELVLLRRWSAPLGRDAWSAAVLHGGLVWRVGCHHAHTTEEAAARCARRTVRAAWRRRREAADVALVNGGGTVEWRWPYGTRGAVEYARETPLPPTDDEQMHLYGPVDGD